MRSEPDSVPGAEPADGSDFGGAPSDEPCGETPVACVLPVDREALMAAATLLRLATDLHGGTYRTVLPRAIGAPLWAASDWGNGIVLDEWCTSVPPSATAPSPLAGLAAASGRSFLTHPLCSTERAGLLACYDVAAALAAGIPDDLTAMGLPPAAAAITLPAIERWIATRTYRETGQNGAAGRETWRNALAVLAAIEHLSGAILEGRITGTCGLTAAGARFVLGRFRDALAPAARVAFLMRWATQDAGATGAPPRGPRRPPLGGTTGAGEDELLFTSFADFVTVSDWTAWAANQDHTVGARSPVDAVLDLLDSPRAAVRAAAAAGLSGLTVPAGIPTPRRRTAQR